MNYTLISSALPKVTNVTSAHPIYTQIYLFFKIFIVLFHITI